MNLVFRELGTPRPPQSLEEKLAVLNQLGYEHVFVRTQGMDDDCFWVCPKGRYPEGAVGIDDDLEKAVDEALGELARGVAIAQR